MLSSIRRAVGAKAAEPQARRPRRSRPDLETLEGRQLLSITSEFLVNTTTRNAQIHSANASAPNGLSVVVWEDEFSSTDHDIRAQMFDSSGGNLGPEKVVDFDPDMATNPKVSMDANGDWVVAWVKSSPGVHSQVWAQRYSSSGAPIGNRINISDLAWYDNYDPSVAMSSSGNFVVSFTVAIDGSREDIVAQYRDFSSGNLLKFYQVGSANVHETKSSVAIDPNGNEFALAYQELIGGFPDEDIRMREFSTGGSQFGDFFIANTSAREMNPSVSMDDAGNVVVAYQKFVGSDFDIKAVRVSNTGVQGGEINIRNTFAQEVNPTVALSHTGGAFVVAYETDLLGIPGNRTVEVAEVNASDQVVEGHNLPGFPNNASPALSIDTNGDYLLTYTGGIGADPNIYRRYGRLLG